MVEVRTLELPPQQVWNLATAFPAALLESLTTAGFADSQTHAATDSIAMPRLLATPRRFAALLRGVLWQPPPRTKTKKGPKWQACFDADGNETPALRGFKKSVAPHAVREQNGYAVAAIPAGVSAATLSDHLQNHLEQILTQINTPRKMRWGANEFKFVRPVTGLTIYGDDQPITAKAFGVAATPKTVGHPVTHPKPFALAHAEDYERAMLKTGGVLVDLNDRRDAIREELEQSAPEPMIPDELLDEVTALCESPHLYRGSFDQKFLEFPAIPDLFIYTCLTKHQRIFPALAGGRVDARVSQLATTFYYITDNAPHNPKAMQAGFARVVHARLDDLQFYCNEDDKFSMDTMHERLRAITYHHQLGSQADRVTRLVEIATEFAALAKLGPMLKKELLRAAKTCKLDLASAVVGEYPELEGQVAALYYNGLNQSVFDAVDIHNSNDGIGERKLIARLLVAVVCLEKLVGMFGVGETISGSHDPHGLRGDAAAVAVVEPTLPAAMSLPVLIRTVRDAFSADALPNFCLETIWDFILERRKQTLLTTESVDKSIVNAVSHHRPHSVSELDSKVGAVRALMTKKKATAALVQINKRVANILRKSAADATIPTQIDAKLFDDIAERKLHDALQSAAAATPPLLAKHQYKKVLANTAALIPLIDHFFDAVLVNAEDAATRNNRLALLTQLHQQLTCVADLSQLQPPQP